MKVPFSAAIHLRGPENMSYEFSEKAIHEIEEVGTEAVLRAGRVIRDRLGSPAEVLSKGASDYVTDVDRQCESLIMEAIQRHFPDHHIMSEETPFHGWKPGVTWIIDPLDGTTNFIHGFPFVAVSVGVCVDGEMLVGFVLDTVRGELFSARRGQGASVNGRRIRVREVASRDEALVSTGFPFRNKGLVDPFLVTFKRILEEVSDVRRTGAAALDLAYLAAGRVNGFWEAGLKTWDVAAGSLLIQEAGGCVTDFWGESDYLRNGHIVAGTPSLHPFLLEQVQRSLAKSVKNDHLNVDGSTPSRTRG
jgi:myo-inositol-1(or 4)-monophosphatase